MDQIDPVRCRRCGRPLHDPLAIAVELGARCALVTLMDATTGPQGPASVSHATELPSARLRAVVRPRDPDGR